MTHRGAISTLMSWHFGLRVLDVMGLGPVPYVDKNNQPYQPCQLVSVPFFHVSGTHGGLLLALWSGTKLVIMKKWDPPEAVRLIELEKVSRFGGVPTMAAEILGEAKKVGAKLESIRLIDTGGAARPADQAREMAESIPNVLTGTSYGMTETNALGIAIRGKEYLENPEVTGRLSAPLAEMRIVDEFDNDVDLDITYLFQYEDLPSVFKRYIVSRASVRAATQLVNNPQLVQLLQQQEAMTRAACMEYECEQGDHSYFGLTHNQTYKAYQPYRALQR